MPEKVLAMTQIAADKMEMREYELPPVPIDGAILKMEASGVCGSDVSSFAQNRPDRILGHENVGRIYQIGEGARQVWGLEEGDLVALEEYLACHQCEWCHKGEYRHCLYTDPKYNKDFLRYGSTPITREPSLWGGFSQYLYMPFSSVWHHVPQGVPTAEASLHIALGNGVQWACNAGGVTAGSSVLIQGPGQMGTACVVAAKNAGADLIIVSGLTSDADRFAICSQLGADYLIDVQTEDLRDRVAELTSGQGVDSVIDTTSHSAGAEPTLIAIDVVRRRGGTIVVQGGASFADFPMTELSQKDITLRQARGHSWHAVERGLRLMATRRYPLHLMHTHDFSLAEADVAVRATGGLSIDATRALHVSVLPWS
jgi:threonine dehydrogenase-like Zn-dependent dehydrogenase